ncbi:GroES-like protein [Hypoxylon rubiginosum]|uniref:GroES-like protein n=1 Tax=Hypoxylon rubiginosum TaxID=110542 RepID=A0ACB9Z7T2_9PEZI|nr:GroES-like protein [Hypoxylon rubiginosum]
MPPSNTAAWLPAKSVKPLQIGPAPYTPPGPGQIVVKNSAVAINPLDWIKQSLGDILLGHIKYPFILGGDVAGKVVEIGPGVRRFQVGDRVLGQAVSTAPDSNNPAEGGFQQYTIIRELYAAAIPDFISYEEACVIPLTLATAGYGLFHHDFLALDLPQVPAPPANNKALIVTAGASSVGANAVQLAVSAGYEVYSTSSPKNFDFVRKLGAAGVFDYHSKTLARDLLAAVRGKELAGAYAVGDGSVEACTEVLRRCGGTTDKKKKLLIAFAGAALPADKVSSTLGLVAYAGSMAWWLGKRAVASRASGVRYKWIDGKDLLREDNVVSRAVFRDFLPRALAERQFVPAPPPLVVGTGLEKIQEAMDLQMKGVSAQKIVVSL